jgi:hypothetical protein
MSSKDFLVDSRAVGFPKSSPRTGAGQAVVKERHQCTAGALLCPKTSGAAGERPKNA